MLRLGSQGQGGIHTESENTRESKREKANAAQQQGLVLSRPWLRYDLTAPYIQLYIPPCDIIFFMVDNCYHVDD